jgi:hypothetical protein
MGDPALAEPARCDADRAAGEHPSVAPRGIQRVLALEIAKQGRAEKIDRDLRDLIRRMSQDCGASRIHGELLMLGFEVAQSTVSKYMVQGGSLSQSWRTFLRNHAAIAAIDLCVVPTLTFERLFAFLVLGHGRRQLLWFEVTRHPTAEFPLGLSAGLFGARQ